MIQVDIQNGEKWDMVKGTLYPELLDLAIKGQIDAVLASPNCRTRSRLRHREVPGLDLPGPSRQWNGGEWGKEGLSEAERQKCFEDDVMMLRSWMIYVVAEECRKAEKMKRKVGFLLEHPAEPKDLPENVSIWRTRQWKTLARLYDLHEVTIDQAALGGESKPTTLGCNYDLTFPELTPRAIPRQQVAGKTAAQLVSESKKLARWTPLLTNAIAEAVLHAQKVTIKIRSWRTHILQNHFPYRKDCLVCQQAAARGKPHYRQALPARAGVLSVDLAGPLEQAGDISRHMAKYMLVASFTWPKVGIQPDYGDVAQPEEDLGPELPEEKKDEEGEDAEVRMMEVESEGDEEKEDRQDWVPTQPADVEYSPTEPAEDPPEEEEKKEVEIVVHRLVLPLPSGSGDDLVKGISEMYLTLRQEGMYVQQIHSDRGGGFAGSKVSKWCLERGIFQSFTAGVDPQANGRAEKSVQVAKESVRRILKGANASTDLWPLAVRSLNETWRRIRLELKEVCPPFLARVLIRKRYWKTQELEARNEAVRYVCPNWQSHGHWILRPNGTLEVTRSVLAEAQVPILDAAWIALEDAPDPLEVRRRIRGKMQVKRLREETEEQKEERKRRELLLQQEAAHLVNDDPEVVQAVAESMKAMALEEPPEEAEVLQTKIVSPMEVKKKVEAWRAAIMAEINALFHTKKALRVLSPEEMKRLVEEEGIAPLPSKAIFTVKPDPNHPSGKKKRRIVACGNFAPQEEGGGEYFASGADATSLRLALSMASRKKWMGINVDVRTAFLNAPMKKGALNEWESDVEEEKPIVLKPPHILVLLGFFTAGQGWEVDMALYGFRQSPKRWSDHRDFQMARMKVRNMVLRQLDCESCLWKIVDESTEEIVGLIVTYVDDLLVLSSQEVAELWIGCIRSTWETSEPEPIGPNSTTRFLGMELSITQDGCWTAQQVGYTTDLLLRNLGGERREWQVREIPASRDGEDSSEEEEEVKKGEAAGQIKEAQRVVGELIWLVTRCRPELMFVISKMASLTTKKPLKVQRMAKNVWQFLAGSIHDGLVFKGTESEDLMVFTDASFGEKEAHGCVVVKWGDDLILWRSSKQGLQTTSTAEAELVEAMEGAVTAEALRVMVEELKDQKVRCWQFTDSASALAIIAGDTASWKTRHLRKRARFLRWRVMVGDIHMRHMPGVDMVADIGTKHLSVSRFLELKTKMGMLTPAKKPDKKTEERREVQVRREEGSERRLQLVILMAMLARGKAQGEEEEVQDEAIDLTVLVIIYTILIILGTLWWERRTLRSLPSPPQVQERTEDQPDPVPQLEQRITEEVGRTLAAMPKVNKIPSMPGSQDLNSPKTPQGDASASSSHQGDTMAPLLKSSAPLPTMPRPFQEEETNSDKTLMIAGSGRCYHRKRDCTGVKMSKSVRKIKFCQICLERFAKDWTGRSPDIYAKTPDHAMHPSSQHFKKVWPDSKGVKYSACQVCTPMIPTKDD